MIEKFGCGYGRATYEGLNNQGVIQALAFAGDLVYVGTSVGNLLRLHGAQWEFMHTFAAGGLWINALGVEPNGVFFLGTSQGLYRMDMRSGNNGSALVQLGTDQGITSLVTALTVLHNQGVLVGTTRAVYFITSDNKIKQIGEGARYSPGVTMGFGIQMMTARIGPSSASRPLFTRSLLLIDLFKVESLIKKTKTLFAEQRRSHRASPKKLLLGDTR